MFDKFFYLPSDEDDEYEICEAVTCKEYDSITHFFVKTERDAKDAVSLLNGLYKETQKK